MSDPMAEDYKQALLRYLLHTEESGSSKASSSTAEALHRTLLQQRYGSHLLNGSAKPSPSSPDFSALSGLLGEVRLPEASSSSLAAAQTVDKTHHIAILGGSFNPITIAHLEAAAAVWKAVGRQEGSPRCAVPASQGNALPVDEVWIVPCGPRPDKPSVNAVNSLDRAVMAALSLEDVFPIQQAEEPEEGIAAGDSGRRKEPTLPVKMMPLEAWEPLALSR